MAQIGLQGENLIFLISQPRAGSTLLQRMLGSHPDIHTVSEPWIMLHPLYAMRSEGHEAEYNAHAAWKGLQTFLETLPDGEKSFIEGTRRMYSYLYNQASAASGRRYFLDKTPRYYFVIPELYRVFPKAQYIILLRNPLAVLSSIINTWIKHSFALYSSKHDLLHAPCFLLSGKEVLGDKAIVVHYEDLVENPENEMRRICEKLGIEFMPEMVEYGRHDIPHWHFGDQKEVYQHTQPVSQNVDKWVRAIKEPQTWRLTYDYLQLLGQETIEQMGYSYEALWQVLQEHRPGRVRMWFTFPITWLLKKSVKDYNRLVRPFVLVAGLIARQGFRGSWLYAIRRLIHVFSKSE